MIVVSTSPVTSQMKLYNNSVPWVQGHYEVVVDHEDDDDKLEDYDVSA